jgi:hypothetical protein
MSHSRAVVVEADNADADPQHGKRGEFVVQQIKSFLTIIVALRHLA